jgi:hypothetical protein
MATVITYDEPGFEGRVFDVAGKIVCLLASAAATDPAIQGRIRRMTRGQGIDCRNCAGCPVGTAQ